MKSPFLLVAARMDFRRILVLIFLAGHIFSAAAQNNAWDVAVLDRILAATPPGQKLAQVGDMQILVSRLSEWRDRLAGKPVPLLAFDGVAAKWPGGVIPYSFDGSVSAVDQKVFLDCAQEWATFAGLQFVARSTQADYVTVEQVGLPGEGGQSAVGMVGGQQFLEISPGSWNHATVCHEIGHTLGLVHEHQRSDRDGFVTILTNNIEPGYEGDFVKLADSQNINAYDFLSIMHYRRDSFSANGQDTIEPLPAYQQYLTVMGNPDPVLSHGDRSGMAAVYGAGPVVDSVVTNTQATGPGSLNAALYFAFDHPDTNVTFDIPTSDPGYSNHVFNIEPSDQLPELAHGTRLDGSTEPNNPNPDGPAILLSGALAPVPDTYASGLYLAGTNCRVKSLIINGFSADGLRIDGTHATGNVVSGCYIGTDATGAVAVSNDVCSLEIMEGASGNLVGGLSAAGRNVICGSTYQGLVIRDPGTVNNTVEGNYIGINAAGTAALSNTWSGVAIFNGAQSNLVGGAMAGEGNVISGNGLQGMTISDPDTSANQVEGNFIGVGPSGANAIPNGWSGVQIFGGAHDNTVGGPAPGQGNIISGNSFQGLAVSDTNSSGNLIEGNWIGTDASGTVVVSNGWSGVEVFGGASGTQIGGSQAGAGNIIAGNGNYGVLIHNPGCNSNVVQGNLIGLNHGTAMPNGYSGVGVFDGAQFNEVGGSLPAMQNTISGNADYGVEMAGLGVVGNCVERNRIGTDPSGLLALGNGWSGVGIYGGAQSNIIGGVAMDEGNLISANGNQGVLLSDAGTTGNVIQGNVIGVDATGNAALPNNYSGVGVFNGAQSNLIGGAVPGAGNVISGNNNQGVALAGTNTAYNVLAGNLIGLNASGTFPAPNAWSGVEIFNGAQANMVGGGIGSRNTISGNGNYGVLMDGGSAGNQVQGNVIGSDVSGLAPVPNLSGGVALWGGAQSNGIGGIQLGDANEIAFNNNGGVQLFDPGTTNNSIRGNSIFGNTNGGILLNTGANHSDPAPVLAGAVLGVGTTITGSLGGLPKALYHVDFYSSPPPASSSQAATWLGTMDVTTDASGSAGILATVGSAIPAGDVITAVATDAAGNSSSLSGGVVVTTTDSVGDGIPDAWRAKYFGGNGTTTNRQSAALADPDGDGMNNYQEFIAGTNPTNSDSVLKLDSVAKSGADIVVSFASVQGIVYRLQSSSGLNAGAWPALLDQIQGTGTNILVTDPGVAQWPRNYYRVLVLR